MAASRKRKAPQKKKAEEGGVGDVVNPTDEAQKESSKGNANRRKSVRTKPHQEAKYFEEKRNLEDLWLAAFPVGTEWDNMDKLHEINWKFPNLENAFEGGELCGKKVYLFGCTEAQMLNVNGVDKVTLIPVVIAVVSPVPPSDKIGVKSVQRETEEIIPMKSMKMAWMPYIPLEDRHSQVERLHTEIYTMGCTQRRSALKFLKVERVKQYDYCLPYLQPLHPDDDEQDTVVHIMYPLDPPVVCEFDWELDDLEEFTDNLIKEEVLWEDQKDKFKEHVKAQVKERKQAQRQAREARKKAIEDMDPKIRSALENLRLYKFYPVQTPDTPDISQVKVSYINRYYGKAHAVL
ncbi:protein HEAT INTOLERANT 4 isoform X2 [Dendrobium catenatum]|uniref:protein HEAT INTOLERANT 4 isoform X2 n=1 Tax=Dendrobium catenatum TaxID=906689 RepID=UPI0009F1E947|nr:protein HEAT INTOLERANT 4 isoform X2 [Dendrobium catenatum]